MKNICIGGCTYELSSYNNAVALTRNVTAVLDENGERKLSCEIFASHSVSDIIKNL